MNYFALFIALPKKLESFIYEEKEKIKNLSINEYVDHPPHVTVVTFSKPYEEIFDEIVFNPTHIAIDKKGYFYDEDKNYTLYYNIKQSSSLIDLHYQVIDNLNKKNIKSLYPYLRSDWKPHITIGKIKDKKYAEKFINEKYKIETTVDRLSYIKYENEKHVNLKEKKYC